MFSGTSSLAVEVHADRVDRPFFHASQQLAVTEEIPRPEAIVALDWDAIFPDRATRASMLTAEHPFFATSSQPDRNSPFWSETFPDVVLRPTFGAHQQLAASEEIPKPEGEISLDWEPSFPDRAWRSWLPTAANPFFAFAPAPERNSPFWSEAFPDRIDRPSFGAHEQQASTEISPRPEGEIALDWEPNFPDRALRSSLHASAHQAFASNLLPIQNAVLVPGWSTVEFPDWIERPRGLAPHEHQAFAENPLTIPTPFAWPPTFPDRAIRPIYPTHEQLAFASNVFPEGKIALDWTPSFPDRATRLTYLPAEQLALVLSVRPEGKIALDWIGWQPERVYRPTYAVTEQLAHALPPRPERTSPLLSEAFPDRVDRFFFHTSLQMAVSEEIPRPEGKISLDWEPSFPDRVVRPFLPAAEQQALSLAPKPESSSSVPWLAVYPDALRQQAKPILPTTSFVALIVPVFPLVEFPDIVARSYSVANRPFFFAPLVQFAPTVHFFEGTYPDIVPAPLRAAFPHLFFPAIPQTIPIPGMPSNDASRGAGEFLTSTPIDAFETSSTGAAGEQTESTGAQGGEQTSSGSQGGSFGSQGSSGGRFGSR